MILDEQVQLRLKSHLEEAVEADRVRRKAAERFQSSLRCIRALLCAGHKSQAAQLIRERKNDLIISGGRVEPEHVGDFVRLEAFAERRLQECSM